MARRHVVLVDPAGTPALQPGGAAASTERAPREWWAATRDALLRVGVRLGFLGAFAAFLANLHLPWRPPTLCLLRQVTGIPCPFCGTTTAAVHLGHLDVVGALAANPFALAVVALAVTSPLTGIGRWLEERVSNRARALAFVAVLAAAEVWQLHRFGLLP